MPVRRAPQPFGAECVTHDLTAPNNGKRKANFVRRELRSASGTGRGGGILRHASLTALLPCLGDLDRLSKVQVGWIEFRSRLQTVPVQDCEAPVFELHQAFRNAASVASG